MGVASNGVGPMTPLVAPTWRSFLSGVLDLFFPPYCAACGAMGAWLCPSCLAELRDLGPCSAARSALPAGIAALGSAAPHRGVARHLVHQLKYGGMRVLATPMAALMAETWPSLLAQAQVVVPVPLHPAHWRQRGYNQAELLANALGAAAGLPVLAGALARREETRSQVGLSRAERLANVDDAFVARGALPMSCTLLVDDVCTTGATLSACAAALRQAGVERVVALTFARAVHGPQQ